jgi:hypothetical protein
MSCCIQLPLGGYPLIAVTALAISFGSVAGSEQNSATQTKATLPMSDVRFGSLADKLSLA